MKLTKSKLKQIIKEEFQKALQKEQKQPFKCPAGTKRTSKSYVCEGKKHPGWFKPAIQFVWASDGKQGWRKTPDAVKEYIYKGDPTVIVGEPDYGDRE